MIFAGVQPFFCQIHGFASIYFIDLGDLDLFSESVFKGSLHDLTAHLQFKIPLFKGF